MDMRTSELISLKCKRFNCQNWHANTNRLETTLNYGLERVWCISALKGSNTVAIGYDEGSVTIKLGREEPAVSMDSSGKFFGPNTPKCSKPILKLSNRLH
uniref:Uncharacterized protein n=1 Tax=Ditylenchus dipsaci TaxID=166011 RepID=A0A915DLD0_9BILA